MSDQDYKGEHVWIIGASSGIGRALAVHLHERGAQLILSARRETALEELREELGAHHRILAFDAAAPEAMKKAVDDVLSHTPRIHRIIFLAALYDPMRLDALNMAKVAEIIQVNLLGVFALIDAVLPVLLRQNSGQLAICGSVAGYIGLPNGQPYSATKSGVINLVESLRAECPKSIDIKLISPGFVRTDLTAKNAFAMPFILEPEAAAKRIADGLRGKAFEIHFPRRFSWILKFIRRLPYVLMIPILRSIKS